MKIKFNILSIATAAMLGAGLSSCNDWLKVDMEDQVMENTLFSDYKGYRTALNGIYQTMIPLYTTNFGPNIDVMAQTYNVSLNNSHTMANWALYRYNTLETENNTIWNSFYNIIANLNIIIEHTEEDSNPLNATQYGMMRGEALGLRAMFHFDLLRLYGPIYSQDPDMICIPYQASSHREILPFLKASEVIDLVIKDLNEATALLKDCDPIITEGTKLTNIVDNGVNSYDTSFRQFRLNYYAVQALRARAYLWKGDKTTAYDIATKDIIDAITTEDLEVFPWITREAATANGMPDLVFSTEVMFSLYHNLRDLEFYNKYFIRTLGKGSRLTFPGEDVIGDSKVATLYESGDLRRNQWQSVEATDAEKQEAELVGGSAPNSLEFRKYASFDANATTTGTEYYRYMVPLVRLSEVYLIAAECAPSEATGREYINAIRAHRNCTDLDPNQDFKDAIFHEMYRETLGESQLFFYYKRLAYNYMLSGTSADGTVEMAPDNYVMPTPLDELAQRATGGK